MLPCLVCLNYATAKPAVGEGKSLLVGYCPANPNSNDARRSNIDELRVPEHLQLLWAPTAQGPGRQTALTPEPEKPLSSDQPPADRSQGRGTCGPATAQPPRDRGLVSPTDHGQQGDGHPADAVTSPSRGLIWILTQTTFFKTIFMTQLEPSVLTGYSLVLRNYRPFSPV